MDAAPERWSTPKRLGIAFAALLALLLVLTIASIRIVDSDPGRAWLARRIAGLAPDTGLTVSIGRIDGSIYSRLTIRDLALGDPDGVFLVAPRVDLDWRPQTLLRNRLTVNTLDADLVRVLRRPRLRDTGRDTPILPDIDIAIGRLTIDRVLLEPPVIGRRAELRIAGRADVRDGRALVDLDARGEADRIAIRLDAEPDRDRFDVAAQVTAPAGGVLAGLARLDRPLAATISGSGRWTDWRGRARATLGTATLSDLAVSAHSGRFTLSGIAAPALVTRGAVARLTAPRVRIDAAATLDDRRLATTLSAASPALRLAARGTLDLGEGAFDGVTVDARLLRPPALIRTLSGRDVRLAATLDGGFSRPTIDFALTAPVAQLGKARFEGLRIAGLATVGDGPLTFPVTLTAPRVRGLGPFLEGLLTNVRVTGPVTLRGLDLVSDALALRSDRTSGRASATLSLETGRYAVALKGRAPRYAVPGVGLVDVDADLKVDPFDRRGDPRVRGRVVARVVRLDNPFFRTMTEGLPVVVADVDIPPSGIVAFSNARLTSPGLRLTGSGTYTPQNVIRFDGSGLSRRFGPLTLRLDGPIERPRVVSRLVRPGMGVGLAGVEVVLEPNPAGWAMAATGRTSYGPATIRGRLLVPPTGPVVVDVAALNAVGMVGRGRLTQVDETLAGTLALTGPGLEGTLRLSRADAVQRLDLALDAENARLATEPPTTVARGTIEGSAILYPDAPVIAGRALLTNLRRDRLTLADADVRLDMKAGRGRLTGALRGRQGVAFALDTDVGFAPERITATLAGTIGGAAVKLAAPAVLTRADDGWLLAPATLILPQGRATVGGRFGDRSAIDARLDGVGLDLVELYDPTLDLSGRVSGTIAATFPANGALPQGRASLRVARFARAGLGAASLPTDLSINASIRDDAAAVRAIVERRGAVVGRMQAQLRPIPGAPSDPWARRLLAAPLVAQLRWNGPSGALWPLAGVDAFDVRGPIAIALDAGGTLGDPAVRGAMRSTGLRLESTVLGTVVEGIALDSRFLGSRLELVSFTGTAGKGGRIAGSGTIDLSAVRGFPMDVRMQLTDAQVLRRDDLRATATGPLRLSNGPKGAVVSGDLLLDRARFRIGRTPAEAVPELVVRQRDADAATRAEAGPPTNWRLDIRAKGSRAEVDGMGLESEWEADLRLTGPADAPEVAGTARLVRGSYEFAGRRFEVTRGLLTFDGGGYPPDPAVDLVAEARVQGLTATLRIGGTLQQPEISFGSVPALPQDEVLSRVLFGTSIANLSAPEALQLAGAVASLRQGSTRNLDVLGVVRRGIGVDRLRVLPGDTTIGRGTTFAAGEYLGDRVYVEVAIDAQRYTATQVEVELTRSLSILSQVATLGGTSVNLRLSKDY